MPGDALPKPGQYLQAHTLGDPDEVIPSSLFAAGPAEFDRRSGQYLLPVSGPLREDWLPGTAIRLRGPLGRGFALPKRVNRLALVALDSGPGRLLPLLGEALARHVEIALFTDSDHSNLPLEIEVQLLSDLQAGIAWADFLAIDLPAFLVEELRSLLGLGMERAPAGQALVLAPMPCGAIADCGVCTLPTRKGPRLACLQGPVFNLNDLL